MHASAQSANRPLISVIIPTLNRAAYVREAIESVFAQDYPRVELIVVDNGSTDDTQKLLAAYGSQLLVRRLTVQGIGIARNAGAALARGEFLAFLDDDDLWVPNKLSVQMQCLLAEPAADVVYGQMQQFASPELPAEVRAKFHHLDGQVLASPLPTSMLIRRAAFERVGPYNEALGLGVEMEWYARLQDTGLTTITLDTVVYRRRLHAGNINVTRAHEQRERLQVLRHVLARRRAAGSAEPPRGATPTPHALSSIHPSAPSPDA
jgi:glycosyltransferase involved in cell wall biosynthesis